MAQRYLCISTHFPAYHPKAGQPTHFIEKIWSSLLRINEHWYSQFLPGYGAAWQLYQKTAPKFHTIRVGDKWKVGDVIVPWSWEGKPYKSKWVRFTPEDELGIPVERLWNISKAGDLFVFDGHVINKSLTLTDIASNDGLEEKDFIDWFAPAGKNEVWEGQIICWNANVRYLPTDPLPQKFPPPNPDRKIIRMK